VDKTGTDGVPGVEDGVLAAFTGEPGHPRGAWSTKPDSGWQPDV